MVHPLKVTSILADETRYKIYEFMLKNKRFFTVQEIAEQFRIHPNVARMHLTKLGEIHLIHIDTLKTGKGGRPGRIYKAKEEGINLSFPKRNDDQLVKWLLEVIQRLGPDSVDVAKKVSYEDGYQSMKKKLTLMKKFKQTITYQGKLKTLSNSSSLIGYVSEVTEKEQDVQVIFTLYNCPFQNQLSQYPELICALHESYLKGQIDALFPRNQMIHFESKIHNCEFCQYKMNLKDTKIL